MSQRSRLEPWWEACDRHGHDWQALGFRWRMRWGGFRGWFPVGWAVMRHERCGFCQAERDTPWAARSGKGE